MTPPPGPLELNKKCSGRASIFASQSIVTVSSSVQAGLADCERKRDLQFDNGSIYTVLVV